MKLTLVSLMILIMFKLLINNIIKKINILDKSSPYECGFNNMSNKRMPISINFYIISIIFLIFDLEMMIFIPIIVSLNLTMTKMLMLITMFYLLFIQLSLYFEWSINNIIWKM